MWGSGEVKGYGEGIAPGPHGTRTPRMMTTRTNSRVTAKVNSRQILPEVCEVCWMLVNVDRQTKASMTASRSAA